MFKRSAKVALLLMVASISIFAQSEPVNYLTSNWNKSADSMLEKDGDQIIFSVRNKSSFYQEVALPKGASGKYILFIGRCSSERVEPNGVITGLPYLYGYMHSDEKIEQYLQNMLCQPRRPDEWTTSYGIFKVTGTARRITYFLNQAERMNVPQNGSAARFADVGLYVFDSEIGAKDFVKVFNDKYKSK